MTRFGQCCLLARRLIEGGVRFVTINTFLTVFDEITWDIHGSKPFTSIEGMQNIVAPMYDQAYSALIEDLDQRGMLPNTLVAIWPSLVARRALIRPGAATIGRNVLRPILPAAESKVVESSDAAIPSAVCRTNGPSIRAISSPRSATASASTSKPSYRALPADRSRSSTPANTKSKSCSRRGHARAAPKGLAPTDNAVDPNWSSRLVPRQTNSARDSRIRSIVISVVSHFLSSLGMRTTLAAELVVIPKQVSLVGKEASQRVLVQQARRQYDSVTSPRRNRVLVEQSRDCDDRRRHHSSQGQWPSDRDGQSR